MARGSAGARWPRVGGWGFKINYAEAIADDEKRIVWAELSIQYGWYQRPIGENGYVIQELWELVLYFPDVPPVLGLSPQDIADYARTMDVDPTALQKLNPTLPEALQDGAGWRRGEEVGREVARVNGWLFADETEARDALRKARASRARHLRNQAKSGSP